jgi:hypothetical protein
MAFTMVRVVSDYTLASGSEPTGTVTFVPETLMTNGWTVPRVPIVAPLNVDGKIDQMLAATTDTDTTPVGTKTYRVTERIDGAPVREYLVAIPHTAPVVDGLPTFDLGTANTIASPPVVTFPATGPQGPTGPSGAGVYGSGAPAIAGAVGDYYFRRDTPGTANQRIYICTVAGGAGAATWVGIL